MGETPEPLRGRVAWVTGAASGIGRAIACKLADQGARVGVIDVAAQAALEVAGELRGAGVACDVSDAGAVGDATRELERELGPPDILINAAGVAHGEPVVGHDELAWRRVLDINLTGPFHTTREVLAGMMERGFGRVVNISSGSGVRVGAGSAAYGASKAGLIAFTRAVANEAAASGVTANAVAPGLVDTPMTRHAIGDTERLASVARSSNIANPMGLVLQPEDIAHAVAFLCHPDSRGITGQVLHVNGGSLML
jgi:NAD(P)-dependent dehydrogenase (short-subunit alcohol dehydrogenase family)